MKYNPIFSLLLLAIVILAGVPVVSATSDALVSFNEYYNTNDTRIDSCIVCHGSNVESLNPYGAAYQNDNGDFAAIETQDSDGDGFNNLDEINALTFPGNPEDYPGNTSTIPPGTNDTVGGPLSNASERLGNASERVGNTSERLGNASEGVGNTSERLGNASERVGNASERLGNASERVGNASERLGNASEKISNVSERASNATDNRDDRQSPGFEAILAVFGLLAVVYLARGYIRK
jgi:PGF-CTERM protein